MIQRQKRTSSFRDWRKKQAYNLLPLLSHVASALVTGLGATLKTGFTGHLPVLDMVKSGQPFILVFFHGRLFSLIYYLRNWPFVIMLSISYLGELQTRILHNFGYTTIRGSRSRGGTRALAGMVSLVRKGKIGVFAVDGPRGPYREVKPGAVFVAKKLGVPIVPVTTSAWPSVVLGWVWDRFLLPMPFSRTIVHLGEPILLDGDLSEESVSSDCQRIGQLLAKLEIEADGLSGRIRK